MTHHHLHTRSDYRHTYSPRRLKPPPVRRSLNCTPAIERRVREILTWHAGECGLIADEAKYCIARLYFDNLLSLPDLKLLATVAVYCECVDCIYEIIQIGEGKE